MLAIIASIVTWLAGVYDVYNKAPAFLHGICDFLFGLMVGWVWRAIHGPIW